jgi:hypothetical protein
MARKLRSDRSLRSLRIGRSDLTERDLEETNLVSNTLISSGRNRTRLLLAGIIRFPDVNEVKLGRFNLSNGGETIRREIHLPRF